MLTNSNAVMEWDRVVVYMYHLQNVCRKSSWKVKFTFGTWLFGSFQRKISRSNGTSEKVVLFSQSECSKWKFVLYFFIAIFDNSFRLSWPFFAKMEVICTNGKCDFRMKFTKLSWILLTVWPNCEPARLSMWQ